MREMSHYLSQCWCRSVLQFGITRRWWVIQIKICAKYRDMLPRPRLVCQEPRLRPISRSPGVPDKSSRYAKITHWGLVAPYSDKSIVIIGSDNGLSPVCCQAIVWIYISWTSRNLLQRNCTQNYEHSFKNVCKMTLHSEVGSNQVGCSCAWQRSLSCETNTGATEEVPAPNQSWRFYNHPTSNWPYHGHQIPYFVPRTASWLPPLWSNTDLWPYAAGVCIVTGMSWWILRSRLVECSLRDNSWDLHSRTPERSGILLSDIMQFIYFN